MILGWNVTVVFKIVKLLSLTVRAVKAAVLDFGLWSPVVSSGVFQRTRIVFLLYWRRVGVCLCCLPFSAGIITLMLGWEGLWQRHTIAFSLSHSSCFWSLISAIIMTPAESKLSISICVIQSWVRALKQCHWDASVCYVYVCVCFYDSF